MIERIRNLYKPVQPTVKTAHKVVKYREYLPHAYLQSYVYCYWELFTTESVKEPFVYRVVTDGCIDIFFDLEQSNKSFVMGFCKKYTEFPLEETFHYVGIRFLPTVFSQAFNVDASELSNQFQPLTYISSTTSNFLQAHFTPEIPSIEICTQLDDYLLDIINVQTFNMDGRLYDAIDIILRNFGVVNLKEDIDTGVSQRQLRRLFKYYIGDTPKSFSKVVQFQNILRAKPSSQSLRKNKLFYNFGYYDQAHFIKDFKNFYGVTPSKAFGRE